MNRLSSSLLAASILVAGACGPASGPRPDPGARNSAVISTAEIRAADQSSVYDLVRSLRPHWLQTRGSTSMATDGDIVVYFDNARLGGPEALRQIQTVDVMSVQYFNAAAANYRFGVGHEHGVIQVLSR